MEPRWLDDEEQRAWRSLLDLLRHLGAGMERQLAGSGVSGADFRLLVPLSEGPPDGLRARDLGQAVGWDRSRLSHQVRRMEERGLLSRGGCSGDARGTVVTITEQGRSALAQAAPGHVEWVRSHVFDPLTPADVAVLTAIADKVVARLRDGSADSCDAEPDQSAAPAACP
jgi:DNA-binding MarR family transcriptional regulator